MVAVNARVVDATLKEKVVAVDWNCANADTQYLTHSIHRYSGKFIPQIARQAVELLTQPGELVLDPYCGSGTTLLECSLIGRRAIGVDLNPLAVLITRVKTTPIPSVVLNDFVKSLEEDVSILLRRELQLSLFTTPMHTIHNSMEDARQDERWQDSWYRKWFKEDILLELIALHRRVSATQNPYCQDLALVAFSDILRRCSNANSSYPNVMFDKNRGVLPPATPLFLERLRQISDAVSALEKALLSRPLPVVGIGNARKLQIEDNSIDAIVTHPPYIGSIPYAEYGTLSLTWLGHNPRTLDRELTGGRRQAKDVVDQFSVGFADMLREAHRVLKKGKILFMLLGNPLVHGKRIDLSEMATELAHAVGFRPIVRHYRSGINRRANLMGKETLLFFQK